MGDGSGENMWGQWIDMLSRRVGSVVELSRRTGIHRGTLFDYISRAGSGRKVTVEIILAIARGGDDDPVNGFRAAADLLDVDEEDRDIKAVREAASGLPDSVVSGMIDTVLSWRVRDEERRMADTGELARFIEEQAAT